MRTYIQKRNFETKNKKIDLPQTAEDAEWHRNVQLLYFLFLPSKLFV